MVVQEFEIAGLKLITPDVFGDNRGYFMESYTKKKFEEIGIDVTFVQDNHSYSAAKDTIRGLHFQNTPMSQSKLLRCTAGRLMDVAVDLRRDSPTYKKYVMVELSAENKKLFFIPKGFAHGFLTLSDNVELQYKVDEYYSKELDRSIRFDDPEIGVNWGISNPTLSDKDRNAPFLSQSDVNF